MGAGYHGDGNGKSSSAMSSTLKRRSVLKLADTTASLRESMRETKKREDLVETGINERKREVPPPKVEVPGMPPLPDCNHEGHRLDVRQHLADQYRQITLWLKQHEEMCRTHLDKLQIIDILEENFYDMENLSQEEAALFENKDYTMELLMSPLLHLVKEDIVQLEKAAQRYKRHQVETTRLVNEDRRPYAYDEAIVLEQVGPEARRRVQEQQ